MAREINLVPEIKTEMIKALKLRNLILFICIVVSIASISVVAILGSIVAGQQISLNGKDETLKTLSSKVNSYADLSDFLTIRDQLGKLDYIAENKNVFSRTFGILSALLPTGADRITISKIDLSLANSTPTMVIEAQANAEQEPYIDYNVLDAFKKSMPYMRFDYGNYVNEDGDTIPAYCMIETDSYGNQFSEYGRGNYAYWTIGEEGCNPNQGSSNDYYLEYYDGRDVVQVWRTPQYDSWYSSEYMSLDGAISGVPHFESACIKYSGVKDNGNIKWSESNESCKLVPDGTNGIIVMASSNGREESGELVLRFSATIYLDPDVYSFRNKHMVAIAPSGRHNVTDSYIQLREMFSERAADCADGDSACGKAATEEE